MASVLARKQSKGNSTPINTYARKHITIVTRYGSIWLHTLKLHGAKQDFHILLLRDKVDRVGLWPTALRLTIAVEQGFPSAYVPVDRR